MLWNLFFSFFFSPSLSFLSRAVCSRRGISPPCESLAASSAKCPRGSACSQPSLLHLQVDVAQSPASSPAALKPHVSCGSFLASVAAGDARVMLCLCTLQCWEMLVSSLLFPPGLVVLPQRPQTQIVVTHRNAADRSQVRQVGRHRQHKENRVVVFHTSSVPVKDGALGSGVLILATWSCMKHAPIPKLLELSLRKCLIMGCSLQRCREEERWGPSAPFWAGVSLVTVVSSAVPFGTSVNFEWPVLLGLACLPHSV